MLLGDMKIYMLMTHAQQVEGDKLREHDKENKKATNGTMTILSRIGWWKSLLQSPKVFRSIPFVS